MRILNGVLCPAIISLSLLVLPSAAETSPKVQQSQEGVFVPRGQAGTTGAPPSPRTHATGELVFIETWNGSEVIARLVGFTNDGLIATVGGVETTFPRSRLRRVSRRRPRALKGALVGGSIGALAGLLLPCDVCSLGGSIAGQTALWGGVGALVGHIHGERETLYP